MFKKKKVIEEATPKPVTKPKKVVEVVVEDTKEALTQTNVR